MESLVNILAEHFNAVYPDLKYQVSESEMTIYKEDENGFEILRTTSSIDQNWTLIHTSGSNSGSYGAYSDINLPGNESLIVNG